MEKYLIFAEISLIANDEYKATIDNVFIKSVNAESKEMAIEKSNITADNISDLSDFDYYIYAKTIKEL